MSPVTLGQGTKLWFLPARSLETQQKLLLPWLPGDKGSLVGRRHRESYSIGFCEVLAEGTRKVHRPGFGTGSEMDSYIRGNVFFLWNDGKINPLARTPGNLITFIKYFFFPFQCLVKIKNRRQISLHYMFLCV